jgi:DNA primase
VTLRQTEPGQAICLVRDGDDGGRILRDDMVKLLGAARFHFIEWPEGVKDADQCLLDVGVAALLPRTAVSRLVLSAMSRAREEAGDAGFVGP